MSTSPTPDKFSIYRVVDKATGKVLKYHVRNQREHLQGRVLNITTHPTLSFVLLAADHDLRLANAIARHLGRCLRDLKPEDDIATATAIAIDNLQSVYKRDGKRIRGLFIADRRKGGVIVRRCEATFTPDAV